MPRALITGITGQDGSYLSEHLLARGYEVHGLVRHPAGLASSRIAGWIDRMNLHQSDFGESKHLGELLRRIEPDEVYHLAAQTHVAASVTDPLATLDLNILGTARRCPRPPKFFHASTSLIFGEPDASPQDEGTPLRPVNPYGASKACATDLVRIARDTEGLFLVNGICYNHESPRRDPGFVTAKICAAAARIRQGRQKTLSIGNVAARRDWGDAREFVAGFWASLQVDQPTDYVFATGVLHSVEDVLSIAFRTVGLDWQEHVQTDPGLFRSVDPSRLVGNPTRALQTLGWRASTRFEDLIAEMTHASLS